MECQTETDYYSYQVKDTLKIFGKGFDQRLHFRIFLFQKETSRGKMDFVSFIINDNLQIAGDT